MHFALMSGTLLLVQLVLAAHGYVEVCIIIIIYKCLKSCSLYQSFVCMHVTSIVILVWCSGQSI